ncbi:24775_t:CDS:1, partial [Racocetra persica]
NRQRVIPHHASRFKLSQNITACDPPTLQSVNEILSSIPSREIPITPEEMQTLLQIDLDKFN